MDAGTHPSVEGIKGAVQSKGGTLACPVCGREEEFALEEVSVMSAGMAEGYGTRRVRRGQLVCENCGAWWSWTWPGSGPLAGSPSGTNAERRAGVLRGPVLVF